MVSLLLTRKVNWVLDADIRGFFDTIDHEWLVKFIEPRHEAEGFLAELRERQAKFKLELHPEKTRLIEFGPWVGQNRARRGEGKPETFDFLGFTHICSRKRSNGTFTVLHPLQRLGVITQGRSRMRQSRTSGSVKGVVSNVHSCSDLRHVDVYSGYTNLEWFARSEFGVGNGPQEILRVQGLVDSWPSPDGIAPDLTTPRRAGWILARSWRRAVGGARRRAEAVDTFR